MEEMETGGGTGSPVRGSRGRIGPMPTRTWRMRGFEISEVGRDEALRRSAPVALQGRVTVGRTTGDRIG